MIKGQIKLDSLYNELRRDPFDLIKKPLRFFLLPAFVYLFLKKRWKTEKEIIYLTETVLAGHKLLEKKLNNDYKLFLYNDLNESLSLLNQRVIEEKSNPEYIKEVEKRFESGDKLVALSNNNEVVSYVFISETTAHFPQVKFKVDLDKGCFAVYDVYTFNAFRGKGMYEVIITKLMHTMRKNNFKKFWLWVMKHNQVSVKVHQNLNINHVIKIYTSYYRFGFRFFSEQNADFLLEKLIDEK